MGPSFLASSSTRRHYVRGAAGLLAFVAALAGPAAGTPAAPALLLLTVAAWRGCPTCWALGLLQTRECEACPDGVCRGVATGS